MLRRPTDPSGDLAYDRSATNCLLGASADVSEQPAWCGSSAWAAVSRGCACRYASGRTPSTCPNRSPPSSRRPRPPSRLALAQVGWAAVARAAWLSGPGRLGGWAVGLAALPGVVSAGTGSARTGDQVVELCVRASSSWHRNARNCSCTAWSGAKAGRCRVVIVTPYRGAVSGVDHLPAGARPQPRSAGGSAALRRARRSKAAAPGGIPGRPGGRVDPSARASGCSQRLVAMGPPSASRSSAATGICSWGKRGIVLESASCFIQVHGADDVNGRFHGEQDRADQK